ncbi:MAG: orotidine-5'-phosphate decarboxylase [Rubrivivax sp.]|nr:orotidine-5'-phosphate decarboxylase [Rubrivivax sp.]
MDFRRQIAHAEAIQGSMLCVGLDPEPAKFPLAWRGDASRIFDFCAAIVDATKDLVIAFKPQIAYFAAQRAEDQLERLIAHIHAVAPQVPVILDAKRGDIGATAEQYAREAFERYAADAVTLSPFMGEDSLEPYTRHAGKGLILLCRTSNPGGSDLQAQPLADGGLLYEHIARLAAGPWNAGGQLALVVGATFPQELARVRELAPKLPLLIPGIGAQGGDAQATVRVAWRPDAPIIVSSSRAVLYAGGQAATMAEFTSAARQVAQATRDLLHGARG